MTCRGALERSLGTTLRVWLTLLCLLVGSGAAGRAYALEFTADQITKIDGRTHKASIYYRDQMWRIEHHSLGPVNVTIVRKDKQVVWLLLSRMKHFKTLPYGSEQDLHVTPALEGEIERQQIGTEVREGHPTILYEVTTKQGERAEQYYQWVATDLDFPMKLAKKDGSWIVEYQHVKMRSVSDYLFNLPVNFQPLEDFDKSRGGPSKAP
jgi:hypothetical protein